LTRGHGALLLDL